MVRAIPAHERSSTKFGQVTEPWWDGRPVFVVGGGPSLAGRDLSLLHERGHVLGVNRAADHWPLVDATFSLDREFARRYAAHLAHWGKTHEVYLAVSTDWHRSARQIQGVTYLEREHGRGLSLDPGKIRNGLNSGYGALNLAVLKRAREIFLLGFDLTEPKEKAPTHWHSGYEWGTRSTVKYWQRWADRFVDISHDLAQHRPDVRVYNANPKSAIRAFPFTTYEEIGL
jgi:hypothetical protein